MDPEGPDAERPTGGPAVEPHPDRRASRRRIIIWFAIGIGALAALTVGSLPLISFFGDPDQVAQLVEDTGPLAPLAFIAIQIFQVFAAPIPGQVTGFVGGYLFGAWMGAAYATIGGTIGCALVFILSRRLGRPFVERFVKPEHLERFDFIAERNGALALLFIFIIPIFPDDLVCYIAGLTRIPLFRLILVAFIGRIPGYVVFSVTGSGAAESNVTLIVVLIVAIILAAGLALWQRARLERFLRWVARGRRRT